MVYTWCSQGQSLEPGTLFNLVRGKPLSAEKVDGLQRGQAVGSFDTLWAAFDTLDIALIHWR